MTMLIGYNLGKMAYITADTRATYSDGSYKDVFQKIEIFKDEELIIAIAGRVSLATFIIKEIKKGNLLFSKSPSEFSRRVKPIIKRFLQAISKYVRGHPSSLDVILLFEDFSGKEIKMGTFHLSFCGFDIGKVNINYQRIKRNEFVKIGAIYASEPIKKAVIPDNVSLKLALSTERQTLENYFLVTNELFKLAEELDKKKVHRWKNHNGFYIQTQRRVFCNRR